MKKLTKKDIIKMMEADATEDREHTELSASWSKIWLHCTKAVELARQFPKVEANEDFTIEGTQAHFVGELLLRGKITLDQVPSDFAELEFYYEKAMEIKKDGNLLVEVKVDMTELLHSHTEIYGRSDFVVLHKDGSIDIGDLKWGMGVKVDAYENEQLMLYALGTLDFLNTMGLLDEDMDLNTRVTLHIIQPRLDVSYSYYNTTIGALLDFGNFAREQLIKIKNEEYVFDKGERCQFCKGKSFCPLFANQVATVEPEVATDIATITPEKILELYSKKKDINAFFNAVEKYIKAQCILSENGEWGGYHIVSKEGNREVLDEEALVEQFKAKGCEESELRTLKIVGVGVIDKLAKKYGIAKEDIQGIGKKARDTLEPIADERDLLFGEEE